MCRLEVNNGGGLEGLSAYGNVIFKVLTIILGLEATKLIHGFGFGLNWRLRNVRFACDKSSCYGIGRGI